MNITLARRPSFQGATIGELAIDGRHECYTLEDQVRPDGEKIYGRTAIPAGMYRVMVTMSPRFRRRLPLLLNVPNFEGIRIHPGNTAADTEGCILPGRGHTETTVTQSVLAFDSLLVRIEAAQAAREDVWITIKPAEPARVALAPMQTEW